MAENLYPDSHIEIRGFMAKHYDALLNICSLGLYKRFITDAVKRMDIRPDDHILDLGCGTGRNARLMADYLSSQGHITGMDFSEEMDEQFRRKFNNDDRVRFIRQRIDLMFDLDKLYDKVLISFVIHGLPPDFRGTVIRNAYDHLKPGGRLCILDYSEFHINTTPLFPRIILKTIEGRYAFDFIDRDWKKFLQEYGFDSFSEHFFIRDYVRLLTGQKTG